MRLKFTDWKMEGGEVTERRATCGPQTYVVEKRDEFVFARCAPGALAINGDKSIDFRTVEAAEAACESHLQAILDAAAAIDAAGETP